MKKHHAAVRFAFYTAVISFVAAAVIFLLYFFSGDMRYGFMGYFATLILGAINMVALVILAVVMSKNPSIRRIGSTVILFQLFNIPVALVCFWTGARLANIARITLVNETGIRLEQIQLTGCEKIAIEPLEPESSESVWLEIPCDCQVNVEYVQNDSTMKETVCGYLCVGMGGVFTHNIGGENEIQ